MSNTIHTYSFAFSFTNEKENDRTIYMRDVNTHNEESATHILHGIYGDDIDILEVTIND